MQYTNFISNLSTPWKQEIKCWNFQMVTRNEPTENIKFWILMLYLQRRKAAERCGNGHHVQGHRARQNGRWECPFGNPRAGSHRCGDWPRSMASCCESSAPSLDYSWSRISSASQNTIECPDWNQDQTTDTSLIDWNSIQQYKSRLKAIQLIILSI